MEKLNRPSVKADKNHAIDEDYVSRNRNELLEWTKNNPGEDCDEMTVHSHEFKSPNGRRGRVMMRDGRSEDEDEDEDDDEDMGEGDSKMRRSRSLSPKTHKSVGWDLLPSRSGKLIRVTSYRRMKYVMSKSSKKLSHKLMNNIPHIANIPAVIHSRKDDPENSSEHEENDFQLAPVRQRSLTWTQDYSQRQEFAAADNHSRQDAGDMKRTQHPAKKTTAHEEKKVLLKAEVWKRTSTMGGWTDFLNTTTSNSNQTYSKPFNPYFSFDRWERRLLVLTHDGTLSHYNASGNSSSHSTKKPTGSIHIIENRATVSPKLASLTEQTPTPYRILIRTTMDMEQQTKNLTKNKKWMFCFQSYSEQMTWLSTLSHLLISHAVSKFPNKTDNPTDSIRKKTSHFQDYNTCYSPMISNQNTSVESLNSEQNKISDSTHKTSDHHQNMEISLNQMKASVLTSNKYKKWLPILMIWNLGFLGIKYIAVSSTGVWIHFTLSYTIITILYLMVYNQQNNYDEKQNGINVRSPSSVTVPCQPKKPNYGTCSDEPSLHTNDDGTSTRRTTLDYNQLSSHSNKRTQPCNNSDLKGETSDTGKLNYRPDAGSTTVNLLHNEDATQDTQEKFIGWKPLVNDTGIDLRGPDYLTSKKKIPCVAQLYSLEHVDAIETTSGFLPNMSSRVNLPSLPQNSNKKYIAPDRLVISLSIPSKVPKIGLSSSSSDKEQGIIITMYYVMKNWTREVLNQHYSSNSDSSEENGTMTNNINTTAQSNNSKNDNTSNIHENNPTKTNYPINENMKDQRSQMQSGRNAALLWEHWCQRAPNDPKEQARFKVIIDAPNLRSLGVPSWICKYNGKPLLIKRTGVTGHLFFNKNCIEYDVTFFPFPYMFKQAITYLKEHYFEQLLINFAFLIEGRDESELPECLLGDVLQLCYADPNCVIPDNDFFTGNFVPPTKKKHL